MSLLRWLLIHRKLGIKRRDLVVEVGPGGDPFLRSDVLVEKYMEDGTERHLGLVLDRASVSADGAMLPFRDKSVDYMICSHVLEHVPDPKRFLDELCRVAKRGLIITPHGGYEMLHQNKHHLWYVWNENGILRLRQKKCWNEFPEIQAYFRKVQRLPGFWRFWDKHYSFFNTILHWKGRISCRIEQDEDFDFSGFEKASCGSDSGGHLEEAALPLREHVKSWVARIIRPLISAHWNTDLNDVLCCPMCRGPLSPIAPNSASTACQHCRATFPVKGSIAHLLRR